MRGGGRDACATRAWALGVCDLTKLQSGDAFGTHSGCGTFRT